MTTLALMPTQKGKNSKGAPKNVKGDAKDEEKGKGDRHKQSYQCRLPIAFFPGLQKMAELNGTDPSDEVRAAVREYLQKHGLWPKSLQDLPREEDS